MAALLKGVSKLLLGLSLGPSDEDFIRCLDYEMLERQFAIHKYYPKFVHNLDYLTPQIRRMIGNKPVYAKANKIAKKIRKEQRREDEAAKKEHLREKREQKRELRHEQRQERASEKEEYRQMLRKQKEQRWEMRRHHLNQLAPMSKENSVYLRILDSTPMSHGNLWETISSDDHEPVLFRNPFEDGQDVLRQSRGDHRPRQNSVQLVRSKGFSSRLRDIIMNPKEEEELDLQRTQLFDQTRLTMTMNRGLKNSIMKLADKTHRTSEQIGTY